MKILNKTESPIFILLYVKDTLLEFYLPLSSMIQSLEIEMNFMTYATSVDPDQTAQMIRVQERNQ